MQLHNRQEAEAAAAAAEQHHQVSNELQCLRAMANKHKNLKPVSVALSNIQPVKRLGLLLLPGQPDMDTIVHVYKKKFFSLLNHIYNFTTSTTITTVLRPFVWDYPGESVPEG